MKRALWLASLLAGACVTPGPPQAVAPVEVPRPEAPATPDPRHGVRAAVAAFVSAVEAKDFSAALGLLSQDWRTRYDAQRLERDFGVEPLGADRVRRLKANLEGAVDLSGPAATLTLGNGAAAKLVLEQGGWKLAALE